MAAGDTTRSIAIKFLGDAAGVVAASAEAEAALTKTGAKAEEQAATTEESGAKTEAANAGGMGSFGKLAMAAYAAGAVVVGAAIDMGEKYQESTAKMAAASGMSIQSATKLGNAFLATAGQSTFTGAQMEAAYGPVAMKLNAVNGSALTTKQSLEFMTAAQNAAEATGQDLGTTTGALASVLQTYKMGVSQAATASDTLTNASRLTGSPIEALAASMDKLHAKLGPMAPDLQDTGTLVAALAQQGMTGSRGLASMSGAFTTLMGGSKSTTAEIKSLGLTVTNSSGQFVGMGSLIDQLNPKFAKMSIAQQEAAGKALFGAAAGNVLNGVIKNGSDAYQKLSEKVNEAGSAHEAAETATNTFKGGMEKLEAAGKDLMTILGTTLMPVVMIVIHAFQQVATVLIAAANWVNQNKALMGLLAAVIGTIAGPIILIVGAMKLWEVATTAFTAVQAALNMVLDANPIMVVILLIAAIVVGIMYAWNHFAGFRDAILAIWGDIRGAFQVGKDFISGLLRGTTEDWDTFVGFLAAIPGRVGSFFSGMGSAITSGLKAGLNELINIANNAINGINAVTGVVGIPKIPDIPHLALGGTATAGHPYLVGENGPELFYPGQTGRVVDAQQTANTLGGGGGDMYLTIDLGAGITQRIKISNAQLKSAAMAKVGNNK
jgi:TP901 family phage tail tape measure protein